MGRPKNKITTITKNISVYAKDSEYVDINEIYYKNIVALGVQAHRNGWNEHKENTNVDILQERVSKLALTLDSYLKKHQKLVDVVEKSLKVKVIDDLKDFAETQKKLDEIYKLSKK